MISAGDHRLKVYGVTPFLYELENGKHYMYKHNLQKFKFALSRYRVSVHTLEAE